MTRQFRKQYLRWHKAYENSSRIIFQRTFKELARDIPFENIKEDTYTAYLEVYISDEKILKAFEKVYSSVGVKHGKRVGKNINSQINEKDFTLDGFISEFEKNITRWLLSRGGGRITSVRKNYVQYLKELIALGLAQGRTISQIATDMQKSIKSRNFYRWQSLRIARTETTTASNYAATVAGDVSGVMMDKVWVSAQDARTRRKPDDRFDHYHMNLKKVALDKDFTVSGQPMGFPGDPKGSAGNVVNCRCTVAQVVRRDKNGRIIRVLQPTRYL